MSKAWSHRPYSDLAGSTLKNSPWTFNFWRTSRDLNHSSVSGLRDVLLDSSAPRSASSPKWNMRCAPGVTFPQPLSEQQRLGASPHHLRVPLPGCASLPTFGDILWWHPHFPLQCWGCARLRNEAVLGFWWAFVFWQRRNCTLSMGLHPCFVTLLSFYLPKFVSLCRHPI